jgi:hypothetical protein
VTTRSAQPELAERRGSGKHAVVSDHALAREARVLTRYLLGVDCPPELVERYARGRRAIAETQGKDHASAFAFAHPWSLPALDAASAVIGRAPALRARLHLVAAVLETTPRFADAFLPRHASVLRTIVAIAALTAATALKATIGMPVLWMLSLRDT